MGNNRNECLPSKPSLKAKGMKCCSSQPQKPQSNGDISGMSFLMIAHSHLLTSYLQAAVHLRHQITTQLDHILRPSSHSGPALRQPWPIIAAATSDDPIPDSDFDKTSSDHKQSEPDTKTYLDPEPEPAHGHKVTFRLP